MAKIKELLTFEKIKEVIDIDAITDKKALVEKYVISKDMEEYLVKLLEDFNGPVHKAAQIVGGYGSGKSHLLAFIISILKEPSLQQYIQNPNVQKSAQKLKREFITVEWELQPNDVELSQYFYFEVSTQLAEKYGLHFDFKTEGVVDHKKNIIDLLDFIKLNKPTCGLVVIIDEISDFLKQKVKEKITRDVQFLRVLGQIAQSSDFTFIGAMQEHIFTNPRYIDEAESIGRVSERFQVITIKREDIKRVISKRVLYKSPEQRMKLEKLFNEYKKYYPNIEANIDEYIDLFPLHPYVIQIFSELPYFEKRGVIQFTVQEVEKILNKDFPCLITYDLIFDEINSKHTVKNLETVSPVVNAVQTLDSKVDLLDTRNQKEARQIIKALAVLHLFGKTINNGATLEELANTLLILPENKAMEASDEIGLVLSRLRKATDGQFINVNKDGYYFLDLSIQIDYDQVIERRADNLPGSIQDERILAILKDQLMLGPELVSGGYSDTCAWTLRRSFRKGLFIYETGKGPLIECDGDYQLVFVSPFCVNNRYKAAQNRIICSGVLGIESQNILKRLAAVYLLIGEKYQVGIMEKRFTLLKREFITALVKCYLETGIIEIGNEKKTIKSLISREFNNFEELFTELKPALLQPYFEAKYPKHPRFSQIISRDNIEGELSSAIKDIINRNGINSLFGNSKAILNALDLLDQNGNLNTGQSEVVTTILKEAKDHQGKNVDVATIINNFEQTPYGYNSVITKFIIVLLTYNGEIALKAFGGKTVSSSEVSEVFGSGLEAFTNIKYLFMEGDINPQPLIELFLAVGLSPAQAAKLRISSKRGEAVQDFRTRFLEIQVQYEQVEQRLEIIKLHHGDIIDIKGLKERQEIVKKIPIAEFAAVKTPTDLKKIVYEKEEINTIGRAYQILQQLVWFYDQYFTQLRTELEYALKIRGVLNENPDLIHVQGLKEMLADALTILASADILLDPGQRQPLLGKLQQVRKIYQTAYYKEHERCVGLQVDWNRLDKVIVSDKYRNLSLLKNVRILDKLNFSFVESGITNTRNLRCIDLKIGKLDTEVVCPRCHFPMNYGVSVGKRLAAIEESIETCWQDWGNTILKELNNYRNNIQYLQADEQKAIKQIIQNSALPNEISPILINALNHLFEELEIIEFDPTLLINMLFNDTQVLDYYTLEKKINDFKQQLVAGKDLEKVRIKQAEKAGK